MRIQHNIPALNSYRNYTNNNSKLSKNLEKLSSGFAINRAGDDAAGLAISEKMRAQITGIEVASKNAKDGISVVQTAEGALTEVHDMLNRMFSLAEQANNGIYQKEEREKLQAEIDQLKTEIDRIGDSTNFNGMKLLDGTLADAPTPSMTSEDNPTSKVGVYGVGFKWSSGASLEVKEAFNDAASKGVSLCVATAYNAAGASGAAVGKLTVSLQGVSAASGVCTASYRIKSATINQSDVAATTANFGGDDVAATVFTNAPSVLTLTLDDTQIKGGTVTLTLMDKEFNEVGTLTFGYGKITAANAGTVGTNAAGSTVDAYVTLGSSSITMTDRTDKNAAVSQGALTLQIGDSTNAYDTMAISVDSMKAEALNIHNVDIINNATDAMGRIKNAIEAVSVQRGSLGAYQNRLEHTIQNLGVMRENIQDAEATIRDTDMAEEMMKYTKNNILVQSAQAMLAQANQLPQGVLSLLQ